MAEKLDFIRERLAMRGRDTLTGLLDGPRARGAYLVRSVLQPPWALRIRDEAPLAVMALLRGPCWILHDEVGHREIEPGAVVIGRGPVHYTVADDPATPPQFVIHPDQRATTIDGTDLGEQMRLGVRTWGNDPEGATAILSGVYLMDSEVSRRLLTALPSVVVVPRGEWTTPLVDLLVREMAKEQPGQDAILDRLLDLLLISALRAWFERPEADAPGWYLAHGDPIVGPALRAIYDDPSRAWTVATLARHVGASRAVLARRFTELVGEPPMAFLSGWRLALAADLLREPDATVAMVADAVGYATPYALSTAFKRLHGVSPKDYRAKYPGATVAK